MKRRRQTLKSQASHSILKKWWLVVAVFCQVFASPLSTIAQTATPQPPYTRTVAALIKGMTVNQKVGQLFMLSFMGTDTSPASDIADLVINYRIGGVQLRAANQNIVNGSEGTRQLAELTNRLQALAAITQTTSTVSATATPSGNASQRAFPLGLDFVPLYIAIMQEGDGAPYSNITQGLTQLPSELAIGATWRADNAGIVGQITGRELSSLGINVLMGPVLDVLDDPKPTTPVDIGARVFGGDPYWVGRFGAAYVNGVHIGSRNRLAVVSSRFPGLGSSDRSVEDEIPTVQKSLEQLKQIELAPFFAVTKLTNELPVTSTTDGLLVSHIRYRGFQGNIRASTRPVSLDPIAYQALMSLPEIAPWRNAGGVTFSDNLGVRGVRRFYDPLDLTFNARRVAQEAFLAGNDVLVLGNFGLTNSWQEQLANIKDTVQFFRERYVSDQTFAARVDSALGRIVSLKMKLYQGSFTADNVSVNTYLAGNISSSNEIISNIAKQSVTLLSPSARDLPAIVPAAPGKDESIVFITDDRQMRDCTRCLPYPAISRTALQEIALNLYGPKTTGQLNPSRVSSFSFGDLADYNARAVTVLTPTLSVSATLTATTTVTNATVLPTAVISESLRVQRAIDGADIVVIAMLDLSAESKTTKVFRDFLAQRADALRDKRVVVFAFGAPYYLDTTEISKLTAYFGVYSRMPLFLEAAIRALFGESPPGGASPVSITALNYSLLAQTAPDSNQVIPLNASNPLSSTQVAAGSLEVKIGDKLRLRAGPVFDKNNRVVPDGTQVQFVLAFPTERVEQQQPAISTHDGIAETTVTIERKGTMEIRAQADPALTSYVIRVNIGDNAASIETIKPTALPTIRPEPSPTVTDRPTVPATLSTTPVSPIATSAPAIIKSNLGGFVITMLVLMVIALVAVLTLNATGRLRPNMRWRVILISWSAGWISYIMYVTALPETTRIAMTMGWYGSVILAVAVSSFVLISGVGITLFADQQHSKPVN